MDVTGQRQQQALQALAQCVILLASTLQPGHPGHGDKTAVVVTIGDCVEHLALLFSEAYDHAIDHTTAR
jgi:hypothetical protein